MERGGQSGTEGWGTKRVRDGKGVWDSNRMIAGGAGGREYGESFHGNPRACAHAHVRGWRVGAGGHDPAPTPTEMHAGIGHWRLKWFDLR